MTVIDLVHDIHVFINVWKIKNDRMKVKYDRLNSYYKISPYFGIDDDYMYSFVHKGILYGWDFGSEELYVDGDDSTDPIMSGEAYDYACAYAAIIAEVYKSVEDEMSRRGWIWDTEDYGYNLYKDGWSTDLAYFPLGEWDDIVGDWEYDE